MGKVNQRQLEGRTREDRVRIRKTIGKLADLTVQAPTRKRYQHALGLFSQYLSKARITLPRDKAELDPILADYVEYLWSSGSGRALASDTLAAVQDKQPQVKGSLQKSWRLVKTWNLNEIPNRAPPLPESALHAMVGHAFSHNRPLFGLSLLLGFYGMLRTGELLTVQPGHLTQNKANEPVVLSLGFTKGGKRQGAAESITVGVQVVTRLLWAWKETFHPRSLLCPPPHVWRKMFAETVESLGFAKFQFRPYSLRRGGSTFWFGQHASLDRLLVQGRWASQKTARIYVNEGLALLAELQLPWDKTNSHFLTEYSRMCHRPLTKLDLTCGTRRSGGRGEKHGKPKFFFRVYEV